jgi:7-cyano-7-deazaguanine synthase
LYGTKIKKFKVKIDMQEKKKAVVLLSGGLDSATVLAMALDEGFEVYAMSFSYGQRHAAELECARQQAEGRAKEFRVVEIDLRAFGASALTDDIEVPKHDSVEDMEAEVPITYVPARNTIFLSYALAWAEVLGAFDVFIGVNALDYSGYPDCRPAFIEAYETMANLATVAGASGKKLQIRAPLLHLNKAEIIQKGIDLGVDYSLTTSCYDPDSEGRACGRCDSCLLRQRGFDRAGLSDPRPYQKN